MIGGFQTFYNLFPFIVEILAKDYMIQSQFCAGTLISYDWVLTAAHCVCKRVPEQTFVAAGKNCIEIFGSNNEIPYCQVRLVKFISYHEEYNSARERHDIGLLKTLTPFTPSSYISIVPMPSELFEGELSEIFKYCYSAGWGYIGDNNIQMFNFSAKAWTYNVDNRKSRTIVYAVLPLISIKQCQRISSNATGMYYDVDDTQLCTLYYPGRKSVCRGDSGGPLICGSKQYGIISWSYSCGIPRIGADVYTRVDVYLDWLNSTMEKYNKIKIQNKLNEAAQFILWRRSSKNISTNTADIVYKNVSMLFVILFNYILVRFFN